MPLINLIVFYDKQVGNVTEEREGNIIYLM